MTARLVALAATLVLAACETPVPDTDEASCQVYRSFATALTELPEGYSQVVRDTTSNHLIDADGGATAAPTTFRPAISLPTTTPRRVSRTTLQPISSKCACCPKHASTSALTLALQTP
ncbi:MAG: hypothetical protein IPL62_13130 [Caulobacteraceae bacterium]|nr:hypothetical protein [Caulobacteraceae bacterium]